MPGGAAGALSAARLLGRNWPLVVLLVMIGALFWPTENTDEDVVMGKPNRTSEIAKRPAMT
jgi:hypothetical protein